MNKKVLRFIGYGSLFYFVKVLISYIGFNLISPFRKYLLRRSAEVLNYYNSLENNK